MSAGAAACRAADQIEGKTMTDQSDIEATREGIAHYLNENYHISVEAARILVDSEAHETTVRDAIRSGSWNYYPGDRIAELSSLAPRPLVILRDDDLTDSWLSSPPLISTRFNSASRTTGSRYGSTRSRGPARSGREAGTAKSDSAPRAPQVALRHGPNATIAPAESNNRHKEVMTPHG